jgi:hypothetical protein
MSKTYVKQAVPAALVAALAMLRMPGLCGADVDLSAGKIAPA